MWTKGKHIQSPTNLRVSQVSELKKGGRELSHSCPGFVFLFTSIPKLLLINSYKFRPPTLWKGFSWVLAKKVTELFYSSVFIYVSKHQCEWEKQMGMPVSYLITNKNVNTSGTLSVNLVNLVERNIKHQRKFSSNFWGNHFFQVDCVINWKEKIITVF